MYQVDLMIVLTILRKLLPSVMQILVNIAMKMETFTSVMKTAQLVVSMKLIVVIPHV
jgi:hypothetical protein